MAFIVLLSLQKEERRADTEIPTDIELPSFRS